ncbi:MAG: FliO/MopB family protein [Bacillota bacterium]
MDYRWEIVKISVYLLFIIALIYLFAYFMKNRLIATKSNRYIEVIERIQLVPKSSLSLVKIQDKVLLLGHTEHSVDVLDSWNVDEFETKISNNKHLSFKDYIQEILAKKGSIKQGRDNDE